MNTVDRAATEVVLGVADSLTGRTAMQVAVDIATQGQLTLDLVRVQTADDSAADDEVLGQLWNAALDRAPHLAITGQVIRGEVDPILVDRSAGSALLVLGAGNPSNDSLRQLLAHTVCPVIVVDAAEHIVEYRAGTSLAAQPTRT